MTKHNTTNSFPNRNVEVIQAILRFLGDEIIKRDVPELNKYCDTWFVLLPGVHGGINSFLEPLLRNPLHYGINPGESIVDMGCGCGVIGILLAKFNTRVISIDINPIAIQNTRINIILNNVEIQAFQSDMFQSLHSEHQFDHIIFHIPFFLDEWSPKPSMWVITPNKIRSFFIQSKFRLLHHGKLLIIASDLEDLNLIINIGASEGFCLNNSWGFPSNYKLPRRYYKKKISETIYYLQFNLNS